MAAVEGLNVLGRRAVLASAIALAGLAGRARAYDEIDIVDLKVVDRDTGRELPLWRHGGRLFVAGEQGERYSLRIANRTGGRLLVVLSVDGVNVISGETARYDGRGYILAPHRTADIRGWRKSETQIAAFAFTDLPGSYAAETGRPANVGVIGMAVFEERPAPAVSPLAVTPAPATPRPPLAPPAGVAPPPPLPIPPVEKPVPGRFAGGSAAPERDARLGTAHGALERSISRTAPFERTTAYPQLVRQIEYDSHANLVALGVIPSPPGPGARPRAFPGNGAAPGFVPDPPARY